MCTYIYIFGKWSYGVKAKDGSTQLFSTSASERPANISLNKSGRADASVPRRLIKQLVICSELHILSFLPSHVLFGVGGQSPLPFSCCATEMSSSSPCPVLP